MQVDEQPPDLLVFAAASLTNVFNDISNEFEQSNGLRIINAYGASQMLAQQIANGAPADVFISAGEFPIDFLSDRGLLVSDATEIINNTLVIVVRDEYEIESDSIDDLMIELSGEFTIADPALSPAGMYAKELMINLGVWDSIESTIVFAPDVRVALAYVESGNVGAAIVYKTDAIMSNKVRVFDIIPNGIHSPIIYPAAIIVDSENNAVAQQFIEFLISDRTDRIWEKFGFLVTVQDHTNIDQGVMAER
jgi:molybdate transport system substrate-binding protein